MTRSAYRPKRSLKSELVSLALLFSLPAAIAAVFPWQSIGWKAADRRPAPAACSFIVLSETGEAAHLAAAKSAWLLKGSRPRDRWIDMAVGELPAAAVPPAMPRRPESAGEGFPVADLRYRLDLMPATVAAAEPSAIAASPAEERRPAFTRGELLENDLINDMKGK